MARFYLEISADDGFRADDSYGLELSGIGEAKAVAAKALCDLARLTTPIHGRTFSVTVKDARSDSVFTAELAITFHNDYFTVPCKSSPATSHTRGTTVGE